MSLSNGVGGRTFLKSVREWFTQGADADKAGLEPGWNYLDVQEFAQASDDTDAHIVVTSKNTQPRAIAFESLADMVDDLMADTVATESTNPTQTLHKRGRRIVSVISGKGGVGKTTVVLGLAGAAATRGQRVLLIDLDPQGSLTLTALGSPPSRGVQAAFEESSLSAEICASTWSFGRGKIDVVPAQRSLAQVDQPVSALHAHSILAQRMGDLSSYDLVAIDAPSTLGSLTFEAVALAHDVLVVTEPSRFGLSSAGDAVEFARLARSGSKNWIRSVHVLLNKHDGSDESLYRLRELKRNFGEERLETVIESNAEINYANGAGAVVQQIPGAAALKASAAFGALLDELAV